MPLWLHNTVSAALGVLLHRVCLCAFYIPVHLVAHGLKLTWQHRNMTDALVGEVMRDYWSLTPIFISQHLFDRYKRLNQPALSRFKIENRDLGSTFRRSMDATLLTPQSSALVYIPHASTWQNTAFCPHSVSVCSIWFSQ
jgi:hypothetical protein